jgi:hypothetical protein
VYKTKTDAAFAIDFLVSDDTFTLSGKASLITRLIDANGRANSSGRSAAIAIIFLNEVFSKLPKSLRTKILRNQNLMYSTHTLVSVHVQCRYTENTTYNHRQRLMITQCFWSIASSPAWDLSSYSFHELHKSRSRQSPALAVCSFVDSVDSLQKISWRSVG